MNNRRTRSRGGARLLIALGMALFAVISYCSSRQYNPVTEREQYISLSQDEEIALGLQAVPEMISQFQGEEEDPRVQQLIDQVCRQILSNSDAGRTDWQFECTMLNDEQTINAFALPGGPTFMTMALFNRLETEDQLAGVMAHEIGHVVARHSAERIAQQQLTEGLTGAAVLATYDPENPSSRGAAQTAILISNLVTLKFGRDDELEADRLGVRFMGNAGYDPCAMIDVMRILEAAAEGNRQPEFFSTHPNPDNRVGEILNAIQAEFPNVTCP